jgi:predicted transcriptional regulator
LATETALTDRLRRDLNLLHRRIAVLQAVEEHQPVGIMRLSKRLGVPPHKVRYALRVLEQEGLIRPSPKGAVITRKARPFHEELRDVLNEMKITVETLKNSL